MTDKNLKAIKTKVTDETRKLLLVVVCLSLLVVILFGIGA